MKPPRLRLEGIAPLTLNFKVSPACSRPPPLLTLENVADVNDTYPFELGYYYSTCSKAAKMGLPETAASVAHRHPPAAMRYVCSTVRHSKVSWYFASIFAHERNKTGAITRTAPEIHASVRTRACGGRYEGLHIFVSILGEKAAAFARRGMGDMGERHSHVSEE